MARRGASLRNLPLASVIAIAQRRILPVILNQAFRHDGLLIGLKQPLLQVRRFKALSGSLGGDVAGARSDDDFVAFPNRNESRITLRKNTAALPGAWISNFLGTDFLPSIRNCLGHSREST
ncbi:MAG: hypothetical protein A3I66_12025 [Burkholderiales bacterium RIFCSPLOWO2_02_FULL_57_36]|nr:MAG: hypothetical protein A3I66_12025 [Burkholderiales bacterium RIFCSPLOWO2_02_FULL_57_36]